jgi:hypothetical protein
MPNLHGLATPPRADQYNVLEATEYNAYLLAHGVTVLVAIRFHGRVESFDKRCWAERTSAELRKLVERYDWLGKARDWDVRVLWDPKDYAARTRVGLRGRSGEVVRGMADTFGAFAREQEERVGRRKRGADVSVRWCLPSYVVPLHVGMEGCLGIERFLQPALGRRGVEGGVQTREVYVSGLAERYDSLDCERAKLGLFRMTRAVEKKGNLLVVANGKVAWRDDMAGGVLLMKTVEADGSIEWEAPDHDGEDAQQTPLGLSLLRNECLQARDHWLAGNREDGPL